MYIGFCGGGKNGHRYVNLYEAYRDEKGVKRAKIIHRFGREDLLLAKDPQAIEKLRASYDSKKQVEQQAVQDMRLKMIEDAYQRSTGSKELEYKAGAPAPLLCYGHYPLREVWNKDLALHRKFAYIQQSSGSRATWDFNGTAFFLAFLKAMDPRSVLSSFGCQDDFIGDPLRGVSLDQLYDTLDVLKENKDAIFKWVNAKMDKKFGKARASMVFYDVTNAYFETPLTDEEKNLDQLDFGERVQREAEYLLAEKKLPESCFDKDGQVLIDELPDSFWDEDANNRLLHLRMRGPSKEHRTDLPLVSIALVIDKNGLPLDFEVYSGNASEYKTMKPTIRKLKEKYDIKEAIVVADRGLNSVHNLKMLQDLGMGYLVAQKVTNFPAWLTSRMLDLSKYTYFSEKNPSAGCFQVVDNWEKSGPGGEKVNCMLVLTFNEKRKARDDKILDAWVRTVREKAAAGKKIGEHRRGWMSLAATDGKEKVSTVIGVDEAELAKKRRFSGFAAIVYDDAPVSDSETGKASDSGNEAPAAAGTDKPVGKRQLSGRDVTGVYPRLNQIERCFREMKSNFGLRPMFVRTSDHIRGHITVCVLALLLMRLVQNRLRENGTPLSMEELSRTLTDATVTPINISGQLIFQLAGRHSNIRKGRERMKTEELIQMLKDNCITATHMPSVMKACGLTPLRRTSTLAELASCLGTKFKKGEDAVPGVRFVML